MLNSLLQEVADATRHANERSKPAPTDAGSLMIPHMDVIDISRCQICDAAHTIAVLGFDQAALPSVRCSCGAAAAMPEAEAAPVTTAPAQSGEPETRPWLPNTGAIGLPAVDAIAAVSSSSTAIAGTPTGSAYPLRCSAPPTAAEIGAIMQRAMDASAAGARPPYPVRPPRASSDHIGLIFVEMPKFRRRQQQG